MQILDQYLKIKAEIHEYFGYTPDWVEIPLEDNREHYWRVKQNEHGGGRVYYADTLEELENKEGNYYSDEIYTQRFLPKWVYRGPDFTMISCNPGVDGNKFLRVFDNTKEQKGS